MFILWKLEFSSFCPIFLICVRKVLGNTDGNFCHLVHFMLRISFILLCKWKSILLIRCFWSLISLLSAYWGKTDFPMYLKTVSILCKCIGLVLQYLWSCIGSSKMYSGLALKNHNVIIYIDIIIANFYLDTLLTNYCSI